MGQLPSAMSDQCVVRLNSTHLLLNAGEWPKQDVDPTNDPCNVAKQCGFMTGDSFVFDLFSMKFTQGNQSGVCYNGNY